MITKNKIKNMIAQRFQWKVEGALRKDLNIDEKVFCLLRRGSKVDDRKHAHVYRTETQREARYIHERFYKPGVGPTKCVADNSDIDISFSLTSTLMPFIHGELKGTSAIQFGFREPATDHTSDETNNILKKFEKDYNRFSDKANIDSFLSGIIKDNVLDDIYCNGGFFDIRLKAGIDLKTIDLINFRHIIKSVPFFGMAHKSYYHIPNFAAVEEKSFNEIAKYFDLLQMLGLHGFGYFNILYSSQKSTEKYKPVYLPKYVFVAVVPGAFCNEYDADVEKIDFTTFTPKIARAVQEGYFKKKQKEEIVKLEIADSYSYGNGKSYQCEIYYAQNIEQIKKYASRNMNKASHALTFIGAVHV